jgi:uncharacterized protein YndB with AHSA1/START domain
MSKKAVIIKRSVIGLVAIVAGFIGVVAIRPNTFKVERSTTIAAPASAVFARVNDFHKWEGWSPWEELDPKMKRTFEGPPAGVGAIYMWDGDSNVGAGKMTLTESKPNELIRVKLEFTRPFAGVNDTLFSFRPDGSQTAVTWSMSGEYTFLSKAICMFMNMDKMVGGSFEEGLAQLKAKSEAEAKQVARQDSPISETTR